MSDYFDATSSNYYEEYLNENDEFENTPETSPRSEIKAKNREIYSENDLNRALLEIEAGSV